MNVAVEERLEVPAFEKIIIAMKNIRDAFPVHFDLSDIVLRAPVNHAENRKRVAGVDRERTSTRCPFFVIGRWCLPRNRLPQELLEKQLW